MLNKVENCIKREKLCENIDMTFNLYFLYIKWIIIKASFATASI